ncbi:hypothetical protein DPEC_G00348490 [Dallia pectoralis]|uniref:Uncharacterized protein n=1 Tax=Dallia pectoralis TaxID=75939 RepID=A0ACC2F150_DALPE|nr:hypothetical protein DPEC_G00348490 [Dallia pectoralis]
MEQIQNKLAIQGATVGLHEGALRSIMEELKCQREVQDRANETITAQLEQLVLTSPRPEMPLPSPDIPPAAPESASPSREPRLPPPEYFSAYLMTLMSGRALTWASAVWEQKVCARVMTGFGPPGSDRISSRGLFRLCQETRTVGEYSIEFRTLAANSSWCHVLLYDAFAQGLSDEIKDELAARELPRDINSLINVATRIDNQIRERQSTRSQESTRATSFRFPSARSAGPLAPLERGYPSGNTVRDWSPAAPFTPAPLTGVHSTLLIVKTAEKWTANEIQEHLVEHQREARTMSQAKSHRPKNIRVHAQTSATESVTANNTTDLTCYPKTMGLPSFPQTESVCVQSLIGLLNRVLEQTAQTAAVVPPSRGPAAIVQNRCRVCRSAEHSTTSCRQANLCMGCYKSGHWKRECQQRRPRINAQPQSAQAQSRPEQGRASLN